MYKQLPYHGILAMSGMLEQYDFTEGRVTLSGQWGKHQRQGDACILFCRVRGLLGFPELPGLWPWFAFMTVSLASSFRSPFLSGHPPPGSCFFLPSSSQTWPLHSENQIWILDTCISGFNDRSGVLFSLSEWLCHLCSDFRVSMDKARISFRRMDVSLFPKRCRPQV